jgi:hypothetical protein
MKVGMCLSGFTSYKLAHVGVRQHPLRLFGGWKAASTINVLVWLLIYLSLDDFGFGWPWLNVDHV